MRRNDFFASDEGPMHLNLELTTRCTLKCPACPRTILGSQLEIVDMDLDHLEKVIKDNNQVTKLTLSGNHGDPIYYPNFCEALQLITKLKPDLDIFIETNGSHRGLAWWEHVALYVTPKMRFIFSIDGLPQKNFYRVNFDWPSTKSGIDTLRKKTNATLIWKWILFSYNIQDVDEGKRLASELGFEYFMSVESDRYDLVKSMEPKLEGATV